MNNKELSVYGYLKSFISNEKRKVILILCQFNKKSFKGRTVCFPSMLAQAKMKFV